MATPRKTPYPLWFTEALHHAVRVGQADIECSSPRNAVALRGRYYAYRQMVKRHKQAKPSYIRELNSLTFSIILGPPTKLRVVKEPAR